MKIRLEWPGPSTEEYGSKSQRGRDLQGRRGKQAFGDDSRCLHEDPTAAPGDTASLLHAVATRLRLAAAAHGAVPACACPGVHTHPQAEDLAQLRHIVLESARALEHLQSLWVQAGSAQGSDPPPLRPQVSKDTPSGHEPARPTTCLPLQDALPGSCRRRYPEPSLHLDSNHAHPAERQEK